MTVLVTGATGSVGREVVRGLLESGVPVRAVTRDPRRAELPARAEVVAADLERPAELRAALDGVSAVHLFPVPGGAREFAELAVRAGVRRIVVLSSASVLESGAGSLSAQQHAPVERAVEESGVAEWTHLRPGAFALNVLDWAADARTEGVVRLPFAAAAQALVHEADVAAVAVEALLGEGHAGRAYEITGPAAVSQREQVAAIAEAIGEPVRFEELTPEQARQALLGRGCPPEVAEMLLDYLAAAAVAPDVPTSTVRRLTGRPARRFDEWARDHAADFR
ncbi:NAD(P)H-binding protein [Saccharopolyspora gregorii]|uniref:NAD(P)H-binding protein n=1 Tax=Saccharopolyspora gregorii TaxID=33914 RepID=UPI0021AC67EA|nr:NAD(P)H-binding protein [Saccharopolyspora gregorii]